MADEELWGVRNAFFLGCYQQAISEAMTASVSDASRVLCNFCVQRRSHISWAPPSSPLTSPLACADMHRAYIEQAQYRMVIDDVSNDAPMPLQAVKLLASYMAGGRDAKEMALVQLKEWLSSPRAAAEPQLLLVAALVYMHEGDHKEALKCVHQSTDLETMALVSHIYLSMSRVDLARKQVGLMQQQDDDATLTKLAGAWVSMAEGGDKCQDALYEFQELGEKYNMSLTLTNGMALANLHMGKYDEAERLLQEGLAKSSSEPDALANTVVTMTYLRKPADVSNRFVNQLRAVAPSHAWTVKHQELEASFDRCAAAMNGA